MSAAAATNVASSSSGGGRPLRRMDSSSGKSPSNKPSYLLHSPLARRTFSPKAAWKKSRWTGSSSSRLSVDVADYYHGSWESSGNSRNSR